MGTTHTFGFPTAPPPLPLTTTNGTGAPGGGQRPLKGRTGSGTLRPGANGSTLRSVTKWKVAGAVSAIVFLHLISANVLFPYFTNNTIAGAQALADGSFGGMALMSSPSSGSDSNGGGIIRMLSETASAWTGSEPALSKEQSALLERYGDRNFRGQDIWIKRDGLTNPLVLPAQDAASAADPNNVARYKARTFNALYREKCGNSTLLPYSGGTGREWVTTSRAWSRAHGDKVSKYRWCRGGSINEVPELHQVLMLRSTKPRPERAVTVVTQLSLERSPMLEQQCSLWPHPIAAVVYIPLLRGRIFSAEDGPWNLAPLEQGVAEMKALFDRLQALPEGCVLDLEVVVEECCNKDIGSMYPTNAVRNRALMLASTEVVLLLDVDFVTDLSLARTLQEPGRYEDLVDMLSDHRAMVLPAFEAWDQGEWGKRIALEAVHKGKPYIAAKFMYNVVIGFHMSHYPQGHEKTNFWRWINTTEPYEVEYQIGFEPYIMMLKKFVPYYDERFRGYYWNKVQHLMHVSMQNAFRFIIHPEAFVVHVPHRKPSTKIRTRRSGQKERNHVMFLEGLEDMKADRFAPVTGFPHLCLPPDVQRAAAEVVANEEQKEALLRMAELVVKKPEEELEGGGPAALARAKGIYKPTQPAGEVHVQQRPVVASAAAEKAKAKHADAVELQKDLQELEEARAAAAKKAAISEEEEIAEERAAAAAEARETADMVRDIIKKESGARVEVEEDEDEEGAENAAAGADVVAWEAAGRGAAAGKRLYPDEVGDEDAAAVAGGLGGARAAGARARGRARRSGPADDDAEADGESVDADADEETQEVELGGAEEEEEQEQEEQAEEEVAAADEGDSASFDGQLLEDADADAADDDADAVELDNMRRGRRGGKAKAARKDRLRAAQLEAEVAEAEAEAQAQAKAVAGEGEDPVERAAEIEAAVEGHADGSNVDQATAEEMEIEHLEEHEVADQTVDPAPKRKKRGGKGGRRHGRGGSDVLAVDDAAAGEDAQF